MDRKEFLNAVGLSAATITALSCTGCSKTSMGPGSANNPPKGVDFTLDLSEKANANLLVNGGFVVSNSIIVARTNSGEYIAVQQSCTHANYPLTYESNNQQFFCNNHGATFTEKGIQTGGPYSQPLKVYNTTLTNTSLRVYS
ncbi:QcrA and Rieske domain-containing protein [Mucilaginibacter segetis]|uniref:Rieske 2Fe-2S domain-containing protein n=1 Tax=Mucilaginibacter segetis TaxID=2793071 RepID=A0A934PS90_9SPHI|nr:Rieske 2Fe-2S domain-containing protein [Mucilaginibacter segetis]MBK0378676.1 Rieske 2Fe-2S domain-containing protein [Mucilaginibacter segetis]